MPDISRNIIIGTLATVFALWALTPLVFYFLPLDMASRGQIGDLFGSINALFSGLAFAGVVFAILLQRQELALQRQELRESRAEMKRTADAQEAAHQALNKTIWASSYKVALDILEEPRIVKARGDVVSSRDEILTSGLGSGWYLDDAAELVSRSFESVGTMVRKGLIPSEYIIDTWSVPIIRQWRILEPHMRKLRDERSDPFIAQDFEYLAVAAEAFLKEKKVETW